MCRTVGRFLSSLALFLLMSSVWAFGIERVSVSSTGEQGNGSSFIASNPSMNADGRVVAFTSESSNLVIDDTNGFRDVFVHDRDTRITERVSVSSAGIQGNRDSQIPSISADGRFVAFNSYASNLVAGDTNSASDIFVHDRDTGITERVNVSTAGGQADRFSFNPSISADGRIVVFNSRAHNLVAGDTNDAEDIFVHDRDTGITERISVSSAGEQADDNSYLPSISADGRFVAFNSTASSLVVGDTNGYSDSFVHDRDTGITKRVSVSSAGEQADDRTYRLPSISADGRFVAFNSSASNLVEGDGNNYSDYFVHDRFARITRLLSVSSSGEQGDYISTDSPSISADGRIVAFGSGSRNLVTGDSNFKNDIFVTENSQLTITDDLSVSLRRTSGAILIGEYIHFRARLTNTTHQTLTNCKAEMINPQVNGRREFSFFSWPLNVSNPVTNGSIDIAPGKTGQFTLAVSPRVAMRQEIHLIYACDSTQAYRIPFLNTAHLIAKTEPLINEDFVTLANAYPKTHVVIDRDNGKYWTGYTLKVQNNGAQPARVNLGATSDLLSVPVRIRAPFFCEPVDPVNGDWACLSPRTQQLQVDLAASESKKIWVYVHAYRSIERNPTKNRVIIEAFDQAGDIVAKSSIGVSTLD